MVEAVFWLAALLLLYTYALYPLCLIALERLAGTRVHAPPAVERIARWPAVTVVLTACDDEAVIGDKLRNSLALEYPADRLEILVGSDGSGDHTDDVVRAFADPRVRLSSASRGGRSSVLNRCIPAARGEIVVLSNVETRLDPGAVQMLVRHFRDPDVGAVGGRLVHLGADRPGPLALGRIFGASGLDALEGRRGALVGGDGGLLAIRRSRFTLLPESNLADDFVVALRILAGGDRVLHEPGAVAWAETARRGLGTFERRARSATGRFQSFRLLPDLLRPASGFPALAFWSRSVLRACAPAFFAAALAVNLALLAVPFFRLTLALQLALYALAALGTLLRGRGPIARLGSWARDFVGANVAVVVGFWRFVAGSRARPWEQPAGARG